MADKRQINKETAKVVASSELDQLRDIVFGVAKAGLEEHMRQLAETMQQTFHKTEQDYTTKITRLQAELDEKLHQLDDKLGQVDRQHDEKSAELSTYADKISSELEMAEAASKQDSDDIHNRIDKEIAALGNKFSTQLSEALAKLNQVSSELNSSKTDRKTLAKLLATVASNLETDEDSGE
jgi:DNA repair exonuclease SbcCD ATPase subunit